jgi:hydrogenase maturation protease
MSASIVIMGVGNWLLSDDGVGIHAAHSLAQDPPSGVVVVDAGTDALSALPYFEQADRMLIIDAVRAGGSPGTIWLLTESELSAQTGIGTIHAVNLLVSRHLLSPGAVWPMIRIIGVEPGSLDYGMELTPAVAAALPRVTRLSRDLVEAWKKEPFHLAS